LATRSRPTVERSADSILIAVEALPRLRHAIRCRHKHVGLLVANLIACRREVIGNEHYEHAKEVAPDA
jgi:hypothetical protein